MKRIDKDSAAIISILFGGLGIQWFYMRRFTRALIFFFFSWTFIPMLWSFVQGLWWLFGKSQKDFDAQYNVEWLEYQQEKADQERRHQEMLAQISINNSNQNQK